MDPTPLLDRILDDEGITAGLDESETMAMLRVLSDRVRRIAGAANDPATAKRQVECLCREARLIADEIAKLESSESRAELLRRKLGDLNHRSV